MVLPSNVMVVVRADSKLIDQSSPASFAVSVPRGPYVVGIAMWRYRSRRNGSLDQMPTSRSARSQIMGKGLEKGRAWLAP